jgi:type I restriction enzyme S subunit
LTREPRDLAASVRERLLRRAKERGEDFQLVLQRYAIERLLFRLSQSPYHGRFVLKGAMLYVVWGDEAYRPTRDLDLLGYSPAEVGAVAACFRALCAIEVAADGLIFLADSVRAEEIREQAEYGGIRVRLGARLGVARIDVQVDVGFGDVVIPDPKEVEFPVLLDGPAPRIRAYSRESVVAEKLHAAAQLGDTNTRMKDFYDLLTLSRLFPFEGLTLTRAIAATFERRRRPLPDSLPLRAAFFDSEIRASQWRTYLVRNGLETTLRDFTSVGEALRGFLEQPYAALMAGAELQVSWRPGGPWSRFRSYLEYKDSGVEWLGEIPTHWSVNRFKSTITRSQNGLWGDEPNGINDIRCIRVADFDRLTFRVDFSEPTFRSIEERALPGRLLKPGDLLLEKSGGGEKQPVGTVVVYRSSEPAVCSNFVARLSIGENFCSRFLAYAHAAAYSVRLNTRSIKQNTGIQNLDSATYLDERVSLPSAQEQLVIATFLDRETAKIDSLLKSKVRLIGLLRERLAALVEKAVAGEPYQEEVRLGYYIDLLSGFPFPSTSFSRDPSDIRLLRGVNVEPGACRWEDVVRWPKSDTASFDRYQLRPGDIVLGMDRPWIEAGIRVSVISEGDVPSLLLQRVARLRAKQGLTQQYLRLLLSSPLFDAYFNPILTGISVPHISPAQIAAFRFRLPPIEVQDSICRRLEAETIRIEGLSNALSLSAQSLKQYRAALISAAVTGKIDVQGEA